jgi:predicted Zn-dependent protease
VRRVATACAIAALAVAGSGSVLAADGKEIDSVAPGDFSFGAMAVGQPKDLDHARAEGLGLVPPLPLDAYLNGVLAELLGQSPVRQVPAKVYLRASGDWSARSTADANIFVSLGILLRLDTEDEVAALLAHEAAHVVLGHPNSDSVQAAQRRLAQLSALAVDAQRSIAQARGTSADASAADRARLEEQSRALLLSTSVLSPSWTRGQERAADRLGVDLMVRAGYSPQGMVGLLEKQQGFETERAANPQASTLDKQLLGFDTVEKGQEKIGQQQRTIGGTTGELLGALAGAALKGAKKLADQQLGDAGRSHPRTSERIGDVRQYIAAQYAGLAAPEPTAERWDEAKEADGTVDVLENYVAAIEAKGRLSDGDLAAARTLAKAGVADPTKAHAYPNYVDASVQIASNAPDQARADYDAALGGPEPAGAIYTSLSALALASGRGNEAVEIMETGYRRLQEPPALALPLIRTYLQAGRQRDADRLAAQCGMQWPTLQQLCSAEAKGTNAR